MTRKLTYSALAILAVLTIWLGMRVMSPALAYYPPEIFVQALPPSTFIENEIFLPVFITYLTIALVLQFLAFAAIQGRLKGSPGAKGLIFGTVMGVLWAIAFMSSTEFFGTTVRAEIINGVVDIIPLGDRSTTRQRTCFDASDGDTLNRRRLRGHSLCHESACR